MSPNDNHYSIVPDHISMQQYNPATQSQYPPAPDQTCNLQRDIARAVELINKLQSRDRVPDDKLQKLKEVLESPFLNTVREVYESIYNSVDHQASVEVKANVVAKATVAAFGASEGYGHPRVVELPLSTSSNEGLGFSVVGGKELQTPVMITKVSSGGLGDRYGHLKRGDQILSINGTNVEQETHENVVNLMKLSRGSIRLVVRYVPKVLESLESRLETQREKVMLQRSLSKGLDLAQ
eukprot:TRINITY_DN4220_c0_g1_i1.p1 TRINITY_DN4220_c0_g1~~TRINITY_DN4220_c0_g1_i1.p1  ORF type:complete len:262 (+),score=46.05 TRINITY_DN4220_c0_g1_i1:74-787(+)